jgi:hypothetical protein
MNEIFAQIFGSIFWGTVILGFVLLIKWAFERK